MYHISCISAVFVVVSNLMLYINYILNTVLCCEGYHRVLIETFIWISNSYSLLIVDKRSSADVGPTLGLKKSSSLESLQTAVQDATLEDGACLMISCVCQKIVCKEVENKEEEEANFFFFLRPSGSWINSITMKVGFKHWCGSHP